MMLLIKSQKPIVTSSSNAVAPTAAQAAAGNYKKRRVKWHGLEIAIENEAGSVRSGVDRGGKKWSVTMRHPYGYFCQTLGTDGDEFDCYLGPSADSAKMVFIVTTMTPGDWKKPDEQKAMLGFPSEAAARAAYLAHYDDKRFLGDITAMPVADFVAKVRATKDRPAMIKGDFGRPLMMIRLPA